MIINIHSFIDVITNSSTEIFVQANNKSIEMVESLVDGILKIGGSDLRCVDLFDINLKLDKEDLTSYVRDRLEQEVSKQFPELPWRDRFEKVTELLKKYTEDSSEAPSWWENRESLAIEEYQYNLQGSIYLEITPKRDTPLDKKVGELLQKLNSLFSCEVSC